MKKVIVFIESNTTGTGKLFISHALNKGFEVIFITTNPNRYPFLTDLMLFPVTLDTSKPQLIYSYLKTIQGLQAVFSSSEYFIETAAKVASQLKLPCNSVEAITSCRDKAKLFEKLHQANIKTAFTHKVSNINEAQSILQTISFPIVIKPISGSGSVGVKRCNNIDESLVHIHNLLSTTINERGMPLNSQMLIQEYIAGDEYSVEVIGTGDEYHILGITKKYLGAEPYFLEIGHDFPAKLPQSYQQLIEATAINALRCMGLTFGPAHIELRIYGEDVFIIEINPRLAGGMIPQLIQLSSNVNILDLILDLYCGEAIKVIKNKQSYTAIRFIIPTQAGVIQEIKQLDPIPELPNIELFHLSKTVGEHTSQFSDYRDRIGYIIAMSSQLDSAKHSVEYALSRINLFIENDESDNIEDSSLGRVKKTLHPEALAIVNSSISFDVLKKELLTITAIDEAHLLMLIQQNILTLDKGILILNAIKVMKNTQFKEFKTHSITRGTYLLYENILIQKLGIKLGGLNHIGRSRNDINATMFKMQTRDLYQQLFQNMWEFRQNLLLQANLFLELEMPIYSQFQPALPGNYGFYLLAIEEALARHQASLKQHYTDLAQSPMGAGAGAGTSFPIDTHVTANLLGFESTCANALDAVANRDLALNLLSCISILSTTVSRIAQDYQLWTTQEFAFFELPDELTGGSSMLPQKKNPYLLEKIKGKATFTTGYFIAAMVAMQKTLYGNSVEVGTEALVDFHKSFQSITEALTLLKLIIQHAKPIVANLKRSNDNGLTSALCVSDILVKSGLSFREAHNKVGQTISSALQHKRDPQKEIYQLLPDILSGTEKWSETFAFGGGCAKSSMQDQLNHAHKRLRDDGHWMQKIIAFWVKSTMLRQRTVEDLLLNNKEIAC